MTLRNLLKIYSEMKAV